MSTQFQQGHPLPALGPNQAFMSYLSPEDGDVRKIWDRGRPDEVDDARRTFENLVSKKGYSAYRVEGEDGKAGSRMRKFDAEAERMILIPQMAGG